MTEKNYSRQEVAKHQLETAIRLYNEGDFLSAITLAAAPEEVLGKTYREAGGQSAVEHIASIIQQLSWRFSGKELTQTEIIADLNYVRNWLKHAKGPDVLSFDAREIAEDMIGRAIDNYFSVGRDQTVIMRRFRLDHGGD